MVESFFETLEQELITDHVSSLELSFEVRGFL